MIVPTAAAQSGEAQRILSENARRARTMAPDYYSLDKPANLFIHQQRARRALGMLRDAGVVPFEGRRLLEIGCGTGGWLAEFESWGVRRADMAGIDRLGYDGWIGAEYRPVAGTSEGLAWMQRG